MADTPFKTPDKCTAGHIAFKALSPGEQAAVVKATLAFLERAPIPPADRMNALETLANASARVPTIVEAAVRDYPPRTRNENDPFFALSSEAQTAVTLVAIQELGDLKNPIRQKGLLLWIYGLEKLHLILIALNGQCRNTVPGNRNR